MVQFKIYTASRSSDSVRFTFMLFGDNSTVSPSSRLMLVASHPIIDSLVEGCVGDDIYSWPNDKLTAFLFLRRPVR